MQKCSFPSHHPNQIVRGSGSVSFIEAGTEALQAMHRAHVTLKHPLKNDFFAQPPGGGFKHFLFSPGSLGQ